LCIAGDGVGLVLIDAVTTSFALTACEPLPGMQYRMCFTIG
jgi:hypothetical protein